MEILGSLSLTAPNANDQFRTQSWRQDVAAAGFFMDVQMPVTVGTAGTPTVSDLKNLLNYFLSVCSLSYGPSQEFKAFEGISGGELRNIARAFTLKEVPNTFVGVAQTTGAKTFTARLFYWFSPVYAGGRPKWLGGDVCRTFKLELQEGTALTAGPLNLSRTGAATCVVTVVPIYRPGSSGRPVMHPPNYRRINQSKLDAETPEGLVYALWDDNAPFASTVIGKYLARAGDQDVVTNVPPGYMNDEYAQLIDAGGSSIADEETILYAANPFDDLERMPHGKVYVKLISQDVATLKLRALYWPEFTEGDADRFAAHIGKERGQPVLLSVSEHVAPDADEGYASTAPVDVHTAEENAFHVKPGLIGSREGVTALSIPSTVAAGVAGATNTAAQGSKEAVATKAVHAVARKVPGAISPKGERRGSAKAAAGVHGAFAHVHSVNAKAK